MKSFKNLSFSMVTNVYFLSPALVCVIPQLTSGLISVQAPNPMDYVYITGD